MDELSLWENSLEGVRDALGAGTTIQGIDHGGLDDLITLVVHRLPRDVRQFVSDHCTFVSVGGCSYGATFPPNWADSWLIVLDGAMVDRLGEDGTMSVIAHEIAHALLGHSLLDPSTYERGDESLETEAAQQTAAWGFVGIGALPPNERDYP